MYGGIALTNRQLAGDESLLYPFRSPEGGLVTLLVTLAIGAVLAAAVTLWLARRCSLAPARTIVWTIANLLLGIPGLLLLLCLTDWPAVVRCPACSRRHLACHDACEHCGNASKPGPDGTEIFEIPIAA